MSNPALSNTHFTTSSGGSQAQPAQGGREKFGAEELAIVMSHFDVGIIRELREFPRGSRKAPKLYIDAEHGQFLLKRRARGRDDAKKVAFAHHIQLHLAQQQYPLPHLIGTRNDNNSMLQLNGLIYELFEFIPGQGYPMTLESTFESGRVLALYHKLLENFPTDGAPPGASFHNAYAVEQGLKSIAGTRSGEFKQVCEYLIVAYHDAALKVEGLGLSGWPLQIVHADWHPGNMLFRDGKIVAVIDYDSARVLPRVIDVANGALQFSIVRSDEDVSQWPDYLDESRFKRFLRGYDTVVLLSQAELDAVPWLMIESMIAEAVIPILQTGHFSKFDGVAFMTMVRRKVIWIRQRAAELVALAAE
ncbi:MAG: phosphotransferase [Tepidisphaeraceae bacterium]